MITFLVVPAGLFVCGAVAFALALRNAPEGFQDEAGFHLVWSNNLPESADVVCVWDGVAA